MKKILFVCALALIANVASAQTKACCKKGAKKCSKTAAVESSTDDMTIDATQVASALAEAELLAENTPDIERKVCGKSGKVSFYQRSVNEDSGEVSYADVEYDAETKAFVKSASMEILEGEATIRSIDGEKGKACCAKGMKDGKACCKGDKSKKCSKDSKEGTDL